jgi:spermidine/putrescine transport system permease protein
VKNLRLSKYVLPLFSVIAIIYLMIPIAYTFVFSFNDSPKTNLI